MDNLKIARGTLNAEEREIMEEHVSISIRLLSSIPWPKTWNVWWNTLVLTMKISTAPVIPIV